jgi:hypothetical protein
MTDSPKIFEHLIATLLNAKHDVKLPCRYDGEVIERQFDGYREIKLDPLTVIKVAIECKKTTRPVEVGEIEEFITKKNHCHIDRAIVVSFSGFQRTAIASAKKAGINLYYFRPSTEDDIVKFPFSEIVGPVEYDYRFETKAPPKSISKEERALLSIRDSKYSDQYIYNNFGERVVKDRDFISDLIEPYILEMGYTAEILNIDLSKKELYLRGIFGEKEVFLKIISVEIVFQKLSHFKIVGPTEWYILEDVINQKKLLVEKKHVERIRAAYHTK